MSKKPKYAVDLMLDSGVFSAWNRGTTISVKDYIAYLKEHQHLLFSYVNMDVIPGKFGEKRTATQIRESAEGSYRNQQLLKDAGLSPIPVFHQGESFKWLERMLRDGEQYIGISSAKDLWVREQREWLDEVFSLLTNSKGQPLVKTHGFGLTRATVLLRYPFYTTDSTSWSLGAGFGKIFVPRRKGDDWDWAQPPHFVTLSGIQQQSASTQKRQFETHTIYKGKATEHEAWIRKFLYEVCKISEAEARYGTTIRRRALLIYFMKLCEHIYDMRFTERQGRVSEDFDHTVVEGRKPVRPFNVIMMFATSLSREWATLMNDVGARTRLLSYYELKGRSSQVIEDYVTKGIYGDYRKRPPKTNWDSESYRNYRRLRLARIAETQDAESGAAG